MILLHAPATVITRVRPRTLPASRELEVPFEGRAHKLNPQTSVSAFRSFAVEARVHVDDITAEETVRLMLAFYRHVRAPEGLLEEGGDMLHYEWGLSHCGEAELFHIELSREFTEAGGDENSTSRLTVGLHYKPTFTLRAIGEGSLWCFLPRGRGSLRSQHSKRRGILGRGHTASCGGGAGMEPGLRTGLPTRRAGHLEVQAAHPHQDSVGPQPHFLP